MKKSRNRIHRLFGRSFLLSLLIALLTFSSVFSCMAATSVGSWKENLSAKKITVSSGVKKSFKTLMTSQNLNAKPLALLGQQVAAGKNYCILASVTSQKETTKYKDLVLVYMNVDNKGVPSLITKAPITGTIDGVDGSYTYASSAKKMGLTSETKKIFKKAAKSYVGLSLKPLGLLGTQVVSGINYLFLASGTTVTAKPQKSLYYVTVYSPLSGLPQITAVQPVDVAGKAQTK